MSRSLIASMKLMLTGNVSRQAKKYGQDLDGMGRVGTRSMRNMDAAARRLEGGFRGLAARASGVGAAFLGAGGIANMMRVEERFEQLGVDAGKSTEEMEALRAAINRVAAAHRVAAPELTSALEAITTMTGDIDGGRDSLDQIAIAMRASGAAGRDVGNMVAALSANMNIRTPDGLLMALDTIARIGNDGSFELKNFATLGSELFAQYATIGRRGQKAVSEVGTLMNLFAGMKGGNASTSMTVFQNIIGKMLDPTVMDKIEAGGIRLREASGEYRSIVEIMKDITRKAAEIEDGGGRAAASTIFKLMGDKDAASAFNPFINDLRDDGEFNAVDGLSSIRGDGKLITANAERMKQTASAAMESVNTVLADISGGILSEPVKELAEALRGLDKETVENWMRIGGYVAATVAAYKGLKITGEAIGGLRSAANALGGAKSGIGGAVSELADHTRANPLPVYVTNMGSRGGKGGTAARGAGTAATGAAAGSGASAIGFRGVAAMAGRAAPPVAALGIMGAMIESSLDGAGLNDDERAMALRLVAARDRKRLADRTAILNPRADAYDLGYGTPPTENPLRATTLANPARDAVLSSPDPFAVSGGQSTRNADVGIVSNDQVLELLADIMDETRDANISAGERSYSLEREVRKLGASRKAPAGEPFRVMSAP